MTTYSHISRNKWFSSLLIFFFIVFISLFAFVSGLAFGDPIVFFVIGFVFSLFSAGISYFYSDKIVLRMSGAREVSLESHRKLYHLMENLIIATGLPMPKLYIIDDSAPNAFATGRNPEHAVICVTTGLLDKLDKRELEGVLAHELAHVKNYDILYMTLVVVMVGMIVFVSDWMMRSFLWGRRDRKSGQANAVLIVVAIALMVLAPIIATMMKLAISRSREYLADATAALITRYPEGLASALEKIAGDKEPLEAANKATAHMYIINPLHEHTSKLNNLFATHPPVGERIKRLRNM